MSGPRALQTRLGLAIGALIALLWLGAAVFTIDALRREMNEVFDAALRQTAERILPFAIADILDREEEGVTQTVNSGATDEERYRYIVRDNLGRVLIRSQSADATDFPTVTAAGFSQTEKLRIYSDVALRGTLSISVAELIEHRTALGHEVQMALILPLLLVVPLALMGVAYVMRKSFVPLRNFRKALAGRGARDLSPVGLDDLPTEILPMGKTINGLLARLTAAFEAERSFAANAAHELRTPLAGAIAQVQRIQTESCDPQVLQRAVDIETTLKRLVRLSERLMQLARAEGGRLRLESCSDLRPVLQMMVTDARRSGGDVLLALPEVPVISDLDPDIFGILCRNLIENAQLHGTAGKPISVQMSEDGQLTVSNDCDPMSAEVLASLDGRFNRATVAGTGSGIGLSILRTIVERTEGELRFASPIVGSNRGFVAVVSIKSNLKS